MQSPRQILSDSWTSAGGEASALDALTLTGDEPQLPSSFRVAVAAQVSVAATGLAAAGIWKMRSGQAQDVAVDMRHAVVECRSERYLRVDGKPPPPAWDAIAGVYKTRDGFVRLHTNFPHHRDAVCKVLNCKPERDAVQAALMRLDGEAFETAAYAGGLCRRLHALARPMVGNPACQGARRIAADVNHEDRRGGTEAVAQRRSAAGGHSCA
ncbi:hypothetical protein V1283_004564 [Bradyrhizobium sp. AZCC 2262]